MVFLWLGAGEADSFNIDESFLILFMGAFFISWPIAVRIAEAFIRRSGRILETEQSGGALRTDHLRPAATRR